MKLKYYMRGLGIGIVLTTLILTVIGDGKKLSNQEIIRRATKLGMVMAEDKNLGLDTVLEEIKPNPGTDKAEINKTESDNGLTNNAGTSIEASDTNNEEVAATDSEETSGEGYIQDEPEDIAEVQEIPQAEEQDIPQAEEQEITSEELPIADTVTFTVERGMSSGKVSELLFRLEMVQSADEFNQFVIKKGKASVIKVGTFTIKKGASYEEILTAITS